MVIIPDFFFEALEQSNLEIIAIYHEDNGILRKYIENCGCGDDYRRQWAEHFIRVNDIKIDNLVGEIEDDRRRAKEFEKLPGGRQGNIISGDEDNTGIKQAADGQYQKPDPVA